MGGKNHHVSAGTGCSILRMCPGSVSLVRRPRRSSFCPQFLLTWGFYPSESFNMTLEYNGAVIFFEAASLQETEGR